MIDRDGDAPTESIPVVAALDPPTDVFPAVDPALSTLDTARVAAADAPTPPEGLPAVPAQRPDVAPHDPDARIPDEPTVDIPLRDQPAADRPSPEPRTDQPASGAPTADQPIADELTRQTPTAAETARDEPTREDAPGNEPTRDEQTPDESDQGGAAGVGVEDAPTTARLRREKQAPEGPAN